MEKVTARRHKHEGTYHAVRRIGLAYSYIAVTDAEPVMTESGEMIRCKLNRRADFNDPEVDVMIFIGRVEVTWGKNQVLQPELFLWRDKLWLLALESRSGRPWASREVNNLSILYEVQIDNAEVLVEALNS